MGVRHSPKQGDIISIKIGAGKFVLAKVAFVSEHHKGVLFFRAYDVVVKAAEMPETLPSGSRCQFRSFDKYIKSGRWTVAGHDPSTKGDKIASRYVTASGLFEGDKRLRNRRPGELETIDTFVVHSDVSAEKLLRAAFGKSV